MKERINWIDWAKALAAITVVFCHLPQSQEWFYYRYLQAVIIVIFFFCSGYLKKDRGSTKANWKKYWQGLIIPYIIYNLLVYPYWLVKYWMTNGAWPDLFHAIRPLIGALLFEHESAFAEPLDGPLWYLPAILIMHVMVDLCRKMRHQHAILISLCVISFFLYAANKLWYFAPNMTPMGIMRNLPYYYIGYVLGQKRLFRNTDALRDGTGSIVCLAGSMLLFAWHLHAFYADQHLLHIVIFYPVNICFLFGVLYGCKVLDRYKSPIATNLSIGTLVIIGLHIVLITVINYVLGKNGYQWYEALPVAIIITALLYPVILLCKRHIPLLIGKTLSR